MGQKAFDKYGVPWDDRIQTKGIHDRIQQKVLRNGDGWFGWGGFGGSAFRYHPELKMSIGYTCSHLIVVDMCTKMSDFQQMAVDITESLMKDNKGLFPKLNEN